MGRSRPTHSMVKASASSAASSSAAFIMSSSEPEAICSSATGAAFSPSTELSATARRSSFAGIFHIVLNTFTLQPPGTTAMPHVAPMVQTIAACLRRLQHPTRRIARSVRYGRVWRCRCGLWSNSTSLTAPAVEPKADGVMLPMGRRSRAWTQGRGGPGPYTQDVSSEDLRPVFFEAQIDFQGLGLRVPLIRPAGCPSHH